MFGGGGGVVAAGAAAEADGEVGEKPKLRQTYTFNARFLPSFLPQRKKVPLGLVPVPPGPSVSLPLLPLVFFFSFFRQTASVSPTVRETAGKARHHSTGSRVAVPPK